MCWARLSYALTVTGAQALSLSKVTLMLAIIVACFWFCGVYSVLVFPEWLMHLLVSRVDHCLAVPTQWGLGVLCVNEEDLAYVMS